MSKRLHCPSQTRFRRIPFGITVVCLAWFLAQFSNSAAADQIYIDGYQFAIVPDATTGFDGGVGNLLRQETRSSGLQTFSSVQQLDENQIADAFVVSWTYNTLGGMATGARLEIVLRDLASGREIARGGGISRSHLTLDSNLSRAVKHAWAEIRYSSYNPSLHDHNLKAIFGPEQPTFDIDEGEFRKRTTFAPIEGIWATPDNRYVVLVTSDEKKTHGDFVGIIISSNNPLFRKGQPKMYLRETAVPTVYVGDYFTANRQRNGTTFSIEKDAILNFRIRGSDGKETDQTLVRLFPKIEPDSKRSIAERPSPSDPKSEILKGSGSGVIVSAQGHVLTAAHVIANATRIVVTTDKGKQTATVLRVDEINDIAILKIEGGPYASLAVVPSRQVRLGQSVATIGFPNIDLQGFSPKVTRGEISSANGFEDDPRTWQVSVPVQPGNSGGPLLDEDGDVIGIVVAKFGWKAAALTQDIPQNVNYVVKSAYALALLEPYLDATEPEPRLAKANRSFEDMIATAEKSTVLILTY